MFDKNSVISPKAEISSNVKIGPFCFIDKDVIIDEGCELISHVHITGKTKIGKNNVFYPVACEFLSCHSIKEETRSVHEKLFFYVKKKFLPRSRYLRAR